MKRSFRGATLEIPADWGDHSMAMFVAPTLPGARWRELAPTLVMTEAPLVADLTLRTYADRELATLARTLDDFELYDVRDVELHGERAVELRFAWRSDEGPVVQWQRLWARSGSVLAIVASAPASADARAWRLLSEIMDSFRLSDGG